MNQLKYGLKQLSFVAQRRHPTVKQNLMLCFLLCIKTTKLCIRNIYFFFYKKRTTQTIQEQLVVATKTACYY